MLRHKLGALICVGVTAQLFVGVAHAATFTAGVDPAAAGSTQKPQTHTTTLGLSKIDPGLGGNAKSALTKLVDSFPADFAATLTRYSSCPASVVVHGDNKPKCPDSSVLGSASAEAYVPALAFATTSDRGYIFKIDASTIRVWVHVSKPIPAGVVVEGKISQGASPFGPVITWDFTPLADGAQTGSEVRVNRVDFTWQQHAGSSSSGRKCKAPSKKRKGKRRHKPPRCSKRRPRPTATSTAYAPFASAGCATGKWPFAAQMTFADKTTQTANASVSCAKSTPGSSGPSSQPPPPPPGGGGPLCPPVCSALARPNSLGGRNSPVLLHAVTAVLFSGVGSAFSGAGAGPIYAHKLTVGAGHGG
jgi:hypothetical protein